LSFARGLARVALASGCGLYGDTRVAGVARAGASWRLHTARGSVLAPHVVLATNGYSDALWPRLRRTIVPLFGAMAASAELPDEIARRIMPGRAVLYESGAITVYYRVDAHQRLLIGGRGPQREIGGPAAIPHLLAYARTLWPCLAGTAWTHGWGGRLAMTADQYPHVHEPAPGVLVCLGYNGRGVALAAAMGAALAQRIARPTAQFDMPVTSLKTIPLHALWPLAVNAAIVRGRISDFLGI
jgi:glycine/D-amino acid oxidase-like deaminating enzyme